MKFYIVQEGEDDKRLPSSHTCFNQLLIPKYTSQDVLRKNLETAIENSEGFGMVWRLILVELDAYRANYVQLNRV